MKFLVLGGYGIIGKAVVKDLYEFSSGEIVIAGRDINKAKDFALSLGSKRFSVAKIEINDTRSLVKLMESCDICINCIQYYHNLDIMSACIKAKIHYLDLGGMFHYTKKQLKLDNKFKKIGKTAILGIGATPGISNILANYGASFLPEVKSVEIVFADNDKKRYNEKFVLPYSFKTLVDEFTMKPAVFKDGKTIFLSPRSGIKECSFEGQDFQKQKGFLTLHSEIATLPDSLKLKKLKNCEFRVTFSDDFSNKMSWLIDLGFASKDKIKISGKQIPIIDITEKIMNRFVPRLEEIKDSEIIRVILDNKLIIDAVASSKGNIPSGVYDTGVPCSIAAQMISQGLIKEPGVFPPERIINSELFFFELSKRGIIIYKNLRRIN